VVVSFRKNNCRLTHNSIIDMVHSQESAVGLSKIAFISKSFCYRLRGMAAIEGTIRQTVGIIHGRRGEGGFQDKAMIAIDRSVFVKSIMRLIVFYGPV